MTAHHNNKLFSQIMILFGRRKYIENSLIFILAVIFVLLLRRYLSLEPELTPERFEMLMRER